MPLPDELTTAQWLQSIWASLGRIETNLALPPAPLELPAPIVRVDAPDLTDIVTAVTSLRQQAGADEIARALADVLSPRTDDGAGDALRAVADGLKMLDHRLQGFGKQAYGGGSVSLASGQTVGVSGDVTVTGSVEIANDVGNPLPVSGTVTANLGTIGGGATETTLAALPSRANSFKTRVDAFITTANGTTVDLTTFPLAAYAIQVKGTGAIPSLWDVRLEGSLDGTNFSQILQHTNSTGDGAVLYSGAVLSPSLYFRSRCAGLTLGTATGIVVTVLGAVA